MQKVFRIVKKREREDAEGEEEWSRLDTKVDVRGRGVSWASKSVRVLGGGY